MSQRHRAFEEYARRILERELGQPVVQHDDGRKDGMYDLRVGTEHAPDIAVECVAAVDEVRVETWNVGPAKAPIMVESKGDWNLVLQPNARVSKVRTRLHEVVRLCEAASMTGYTPVDWWLKRQQPDVFAALEDLRIHSVSRYDGTGRVTFGMTGYGGAVDMQGHSLPGWIGDFLRAPRQKDVIEKLERSSGVQRHVFIEVDLGGVPGSLSPILAKERLHFHQRLAARHFRFYMLEAEALKEGEGCPQ